MKLLICSNFAPYDSIDHAGGQIHNYYVKRLRLDSNIDIHIVSFAENKDKIDLDKYNISNSIICCDPVGFRARLVRKAMTKWYYWIPRLGHYGFIDGYRKYRMKKELTKLKKSGYSPDIVELNWTQVVLWLPMIRRIFPSAKYYAVEQDVAFLGFERIYRAITTKKSRIKAKKQYELIKRSELLILSKCNMVFTLNDKDKNLLVKNGLPLSKIKTILPYFNRKIFLQSTTFKKSILYFGQMSRMENNTAVLWFIENVLPHLSDIDIVFTVLGSSPSSKLIEMQNDRINITGYQSDIQIYFDEALCLVAPLQFGAGIKIKVLEALSAGLPVLGTEVASEGIAITHGVNFFACNTPEDYIQTIKQLVKEPELALSIGKAAKEFIYQNYNFDESFKDYLQTLNSILEK
jgi:glycosyltransferase involved in cell wall biosynthesis